MMKYLSILVILITSSMAFGANADSSGNCVDCDAKLSGMPGNSGAIKDISAIGTRIVNEDVRKFAHNLCNKISMANISGRDIPNTIRESFADYLGIKTTDSDYQDKVTKFWNENHNDFICRGKYNENTREQEHITKRMVNTGLTDQFFSKFLFEDENINLESFEYIGGDINKPETIIDFLTSIIDDPKKQNRFSIDKLKRLRRSIELHIKYRPED